jgi:hypothetical protein
MSEDLAGYLARPLTPPAAEVAKAIERGPINSGAALPLADAERLLDPSPLPVETGWCSCPTASATSRSARRCRR